MGRKTVKVLIPRKNPDNMLQLIECVNATHRRLGKHSPLDKEDTDALETIYTEAKPEREKALDLEEKAQKHNHKAKQLLGQNDNQTVGTSGTGLYHIAQVRDTLLKKFKGNEERLTEWGFEVTVGTAKNPTRRIK